MKAAIIIPARYASTRLPGKALLDICGKPLIERVYERAQRAKNASAVIVATDDDRIASAVRVFGGEAVMTRSDHRSGSERVAEAGEKLDADIIVNLQGDEPEIDPAHIDLLIDVQSAHRPFASTLVCPIPGNISPDDPAAVKAVLGKPIAANVWEALYFSRTKLPYASERSDSMGGADVQYFLHIGVYAFTRATLKRFALAPPGRLEQYEALEQLRILEMGEKIAAAEVSSSVPGIDTQDDLDAARRRFSKKNA